MSIVELVMHRLWCYTSPHPNSVTTEVERTSVNVNTILQELRAEEKRLNQAISAIENLGNHLPKRGRIGRPKATATPKKRPRRRMSAAARAKLARLMKQRWAARKKAGKSRLGA